jgi:hypothetical protein
MGRKDEPFVDMFHRTLCMAKASGEHGVILNYDDMQMGRKLSFYDVLTTPISTKYPIEPSKAIKEDMQTLGFSDFWEYFFNAERVRKQKKEEEKKAKKKRWFF